MDLKRIFNKKNISNIVFVIAIAVLIYPPSREWAMRQIAFAPSIEKGEDIERIEDYNWQLNGLNTESINFNEFENNVVFVNFWATWCPPCRAELPMIQEFYNDYKDKVKFVFVTTENWNTVENFFTEKGYNFPVYNSQSLPPQNFTETNSIPASYLMDKNGNILIKKVGAANWNSNRVKNLLDKLISE
ncbi:TlpA disulfide reductase family protein [Lutibacter sp. B1]|uniref:TlpA family protein disulfide reductase n=1 Tax=Lutibacter sp. B1 TaxID=2725996 RepID=UPI0014563863|nr:TlpA disulfide reductase family protein [Lutibacter sp. B1]NLP58759.1 TlpA family protein disulfide reductase [Lutibacter sp. B1]